MLKKAFFALVLLNAGFVVANDVTSEVTATVEVAVNANEKVCDILSQVTSSEFFQALNDDNKAELLKMLNSVENLTEENVLSVVAGFKASLSA